MKILRMLRTKDSFYALPAEKRAEIMKSAVAFADKYIGAGKLKEAYFTPELNLAVMIWEVASPEEMAQISMEYALRPYTDYQAYNLVDYDVVRKLGDRPQSTQMEPSRGTVARST